MLDTNQIQLINPTNIFRSNMIKSLGIIVLLAACCSAASLANVASCIGKCPAKDTPNQIVLLASSHCPWYCKCEKGKPKIFECRNEWYFSIDAGTCLPVEESNCPATWSYIAH